MDHIKPSGSLWFYGGRSQPSGAHTYDHLDGARILSGVEDVTDSGMEYHVSLSRAGVRTTNKDAMEILRALDAPFRAEDWLEDNHHPGIARHFWAHTEKEKRRPCPCEANEEPVVDGDFVWRKVTP